MERESSFNHGWIVTFAGTGINLALGVLYSWSILSGEIQGWTQTMRSVPYSIACAVFAFAMIPAGLLQDKASPRLAATIGGVLTGLGFLFCALISTYEGFIIGFGILAGLGIGFGYAAATPPAIKWFPANKTGLIAGIVVAGFGLASAYIAPLARWMLGAFTLPTTMMVFGIGFFCIVTCLAQILKNPPPSFQPEPVQSKSSGAAAPAKAIDIKTSVMIKTARFWLLWIMFAVGAGTGLMIIGKLKPIVQNASSLAWFPPLCLACLAIGNAGGRILAGMLSDRIGRTKAMFLILLCQAGVMIALIFLNQIASAVFFLSILAGFNYGANLSVFPSATKDMFGLKNFGMNYGMMFTAWGFGGLVLPIMAGKIADLTGNFNLAYIICAVALAVAASLTFAVERSSPRRSPQTEPVLAES